MSVAKLLKQFSKGQWLALSNGPNTIVVSHPLTWERQQTSFRNVAFFSAL
jgi:hypothetical protein